MECNEDYRAEMAPEIDGYHLGQGRAQMALGTLKRLGVRPVSIRVNAKGDALIRLSFPDYLKVRDYLWVVDAVDAERPWSHAFAHNGATYVCEFRGSTAPCGYDPDDPDC